MKWRRCKKKKKRKKSDEEKVNSKESTGLYCLSETGEAVSSAHPSAIDSSRAFWQMRRSDLPLRRIAIELLFVHGG